MKSEFFNQDQLSPSVLVSPMLNFSGETCLSLTIAYYSSHVDFRVGMAEAEPIMDTVEYINSLTFGDPWVKTSSTSISVMTTTLPEGSYYIVYRAFASDGYVTIDDISTSEEACGIPNGKYSRCSCCFRLE